MAHQSINLFRTLTLSFLQKFKFENHHHHYHHQRHQCNHHHHQRHQCNHQRHQCHHHYHHFHHHLNCNQLILSLFLLFVLNCNHHKQHQQQLSSSSSSSTTATTTTTTKTTTSMIVSAAITTNKDRPYTSIIYTAVDGGKVALPCNIIPPTIDDHVVLILWYKDDEFEPIYTIDARKDPLEKAKIIASPNLIDRVYFNQHNQPAFLQIDPVQTKDAGEYRCRVDFKKARTINIVIQLKVIVPPEEPIISYKYSQITSHPLKGLIGPFNEGDRLLLICTSFGGKPRPTLTWWKDYSIIDDSYEYKSKDVTINELIIESLARHHLLSIFTCQSSNNNITIASSASITIDLNLKPLEVKITQITKSLLANHDSKFECKSYGSKPKARLYWMLNDVRYDTALQGDMQTISIINLPLKRDNNGHVLSCYAENPKIFNSTIVDHFVLSVEYKPELTLKIGTSTLSLDTLQEGNDIYFDCILDANPMTTKPLIWRFNDEILEPKQGIIQSNYSLVLQNVRRHMSGNYKCEATNQHGTQTSNTINLTIRFAPYCKFESTLAYGLSLYESNSLICEVESDPMPTSFQWIFEKQTELTTFQSYNYSSLLHYRPNSTHHYGTIECIAKNAVGLQQIPCKYHIIDSGPPNFPFYCQLFNQSIDKITIKCTSENDNLSTLKTSNMIENDHQYNDKQIQKTSNHQTIFVHPTTYYIAEIYDKYGHLLKNITLNPLSTFSSNISTLLNQTYPSLKMFYFQIDNLYESSNYKVKIYASNSKGTSDHLWINAQTLRKAEKYILSNLTDTKLLLKNYALSNIKMIIFSVCGILSTILIVIIISITCMSKFCQTIPSNNGDGAGGGGVHKRNKKSVIFKIKNLSTTTNNNYNNDDNDDLTKFNNNNNNENINDNLLFQNNINVFSTNTNNISINNENMNNDNDGVVGGGGGDCTTMINHIDRYNGNKNIGTTINGNYCKNNNNNDNDEELVNNLDNLTIPTVYTETNVFTDDYYNNYLCNYHTINNNNNNDDATTISTMKSNPNNNNKSNMELLGLKFYHINPTITTLPTHLNQINNNNNNNNRNKDPPDLIPTFYYNNHNNINPSTSMTNNDDHDLIEHNHHQADVDLILSTD